MAEPAVYGDREVMLRDYAATMDLFKILVDIRFKLLTFVPTVTTVAVGVLSLDKQQKIFDEGTTLFVGAAGLLISLAIVVYEIRNSQIHDRAVHRIKHLEQLLGFTPSYSGISPRGMFQERGRGETFLWLFTVQHDRALSMVYGVVLTLWTWVLLTGLSDFVGWFDGQNEWPGPGGKVFIAIGVGLIVAAEITRHGGMGREKAITYSLANIFVPGTGEKVTDFSMPAGEQLWRELKRIEELIPKKPYKNSLQQLIQDAKSGSRDKEEGCDAEKMMDLAIASGLLIVRQRLRPPWQPGRGEKRNEKRNRALKIKKGKLPSPARLSAAIAGGQEVLEHFTQRQKIALTKRRAQGKYIALVQAELIQRYGVKAPWCSLGEVRLRWELLTAAAAEPEAALSAPLSATGYTSTTGP
ncbi:hypothetical protein ACX80V_17015 [Arthrobacter sp. MDT3-24]